MGTVSRALKWAPEMTGGPNEIWSFGGDVYAILKDYVMLRERLRPYLHAQARWACKTGVPIMRPLLVEFPQDDTCWGVDDQFMFGPDLLVAPVVERGAGSAPSTSLPALSGRTPGQGQRLRAAPS